VFQQDHCNWRDFLGRATSSGVAHVLVTTRHRASCLLRMCVVASQNCHAFGKPAPPLFSHNNPVKHMLASGTSSVLNTPRLVDNDAAYAVTRGGFMPNSAHSCNRHRLGTYQRTPANTQMTLPPAAVSRKAKVMCPRNASTCCWELHLNCPHFCIW
jgi:hypothetical protein